MHNVSSIIHLEKGRIMARRTKRRMGLQGTFPCIACSHEIPMPLYELLLPKEKKEASIYWADESDNDVEICCPKCGVCQTMRISVVIKRCEAV